MKIEELREAIATADWSDPEFKKVAEGLADLWEAARDMITPVVKEGSHAHERLIEALEKLEKIK